MNDPAKIDPAKFDPAKFDPAKIDSYKELFGLDLPPERLQEVLAAYGDILGEIRKLRALDLTDVHPAIVFEPTAPYRKTP